MLCNLNAQRASRKLVEALRAAVPAEDFLATRSFDEATVAAETIVARGHGAVCVGGGDGTFMQLCTDLLALVPPAEAARLPALLPLRLGTGCAIADVCASSPASAAGFAADVERARTDAAISPLRLMEVAGRLTHFAGVGLDANYADDFRRIVKQGLQRTPLAPLVRGVPGLVITATALTVPRLMVRPRQAMRIVNLGAPARRLGPDGRPFGDPIAAGETLHEGRVTIAAAATIFSYAFGMRFFPFVDQIGDAFQLRVSSAGALRAVATLPKTFKGTYANSDVLWDFAATAVAIELESPAAFHAGGDVQGKTDRVEIRLAKRTVPILRPPPRSDAPAHAAGPRPARRRARTP